MQVFTNVGLKDFEGGCKIAHTERDNLPLFVYFSLVFTHMLVLWKTISSACVQPQQTLTVINTSRWQTDKRKFV